MVKSLLIASALLIANPLLAEEIENEEEVVENNNNEEEVIENSENNEEEKEIVVVVDNEEGKVLIDEIKEEITKLINENEWLKEIVATCGWVYGTLGGASFVSLLIVVIRAIYQAHKNKKIEQKTLDDVEKAILKEVEVVIGKEVKGQIEKPIHELTNSLASVESMQNALSKIVALSQENSYSARLAILECIATLGIVDKKIIDEAREDIKEEQKEEEETKEKANEELDNIIVQTDKNNEELEEYLKGL